MNKITLILLLHQILFQGMFVSKNIILRKQTGKQIQGKNREAIFATLFFILFIALSFLFSFQTEPFGRIAVQPNTIFIIIGLMILFLNLIISTAALIHLKDSWRVGVLENQRTDLVTTGIYRYSRNPYFVSYLLMFIAYATLSQNLVLLGLTIIGFIFVHSMIMKEEAYLTSVHGENYLQYKKEVPRYLLI